MKTPKIFSGPPGSAIAVIAGKRVEIAPEEWRQEHIVDPKDQGYVSSNALLKRLNRKLSKNGDAIRKSRTLARAGGV